MQASAIVRQAGFVCLALATLCACGASPAGDNDGGNDRADSSAISKDDASMGGGEDAQATNGNDSGFITPDASSSPATDATLTPPPPPCLGCRWLCDFPGPCAFPSANAPSCLPSAPAIEVVYPPDNVLVPPNLNVISIQWTPYGGPYQRFEVDFSNPPNTDWRIITKCATQTIDAQSGTPSGGCELIVDPVSWSKLVGANRGLGAVTVTVRGTTDGVCASASTNTVHISFAKEDLFGTFYYWKSTVSANGVGGQIWKKVFGDIATAERDVTSGVFPAATCNGCHALSRDGSRMVVYSDDGDSDDEYSDLAGSLLDLRPVPAIEIQGSVNDAGHGGQPPGFSALHPLVGVAADSAYYVTSNGLPLTSTGTGPSTTSNGYPSPVSTNGWSLWDGQRGGFVGDVRIGAAGTRPTMPDWSIDGKTVVYVQPSAVANWDEDGGASHSDDDHVFGGSFYTVPYTGGGAFGAPSAFLQSAGENNYYPSFSPDVPMTLVLFNRAPLDMSAGSVTGCNGGFCPNDSFSNPAARLMVMVNALGSTPIDLERANGSSASAPVPISNSYPRWAPREQTYQGQRLFWITFSSTRDYGLRVLNHKTGMRQCYPPDAYETPGAIPSQGFAPQCQQPQLWMAPINLSDAKSNADPSRAAFWIPYQDITTHNHMAQWTQETAPPPPFSCNCSSMLNGPCGAANGGCGCCTGTSLTCSGNDICVDTGPH